MPQQKPQITRYAIFTVAEATPNEYGDLIVSDTAGKEHKVGIKRAQLFVTFQVGAEVKVGYAVYKEREYIAIAEPTGTHISMVEKEHRQASPTPLRGRDEDRTDRRNALITTKDLWLGGKIKDDNPLVTWLLAELLIIATGEKKTKVIEAKPTVIQTKEPEPKIKTAGEVLKWITSKDPSIKAPRTWLSENFAVDPKAILTQEKVQELYKAVKAGMNW